MSNTIEVDLGPENGLHRFRSYDQLLSWLQRERSKWSWIDGRNEPGNVGNRLLGKFGALEAQVRNYKDGGHPFVHWKEDLPAFFHPNGDGIVLADSQLGKRVGAIRATYGDIAGVTAFAIGREWARFPDVGTIDQARGALAYVFPSLLGPDVISERLEKERSSLRATVRRMVAEGEDAEANRAAVAFRALQDTRRRSIRWARKFATTWEHERQRHQAAHDTSIAHIDAIAKAYNELMHLRAPAEYWEKKAGRHGTAEGTAMTRLMWFFPIALICLAGAFGFTGWALLQPDAPQETPVYIVVSAGLATFAGVVFWVGRLLTRLYLSEHHLRKDAEERQIMTTTYLALTRDQAADEKDRHIILSALFRSATDGIVKDDGGVDPSLAAALARIGMGGR